MAIAFNNCSLRGQGQTTKQGYITSEVTDQLCIYYPHQAHFDLVCETMPSDSDENIIFCAEAAFTGEYLDTFNHMNIMGPHVCNGTLYQGYDYNKYYGMFVAYDDQWQIATLPNDELIEQVVQHGGMAFTQYWVVKYGEVCPVQIQKDETVHHYRVIAEVRGELCIIDSKESVPYRQFLNALADYGVNNALYMDMGRGWNHSFWREQDGTFHEIHPYYHHYCTNWLTIYK